MRKTMWHKKPRMVNWRKANEMVRRAGKGILCIGIEEQNTKWLAIHFIPREELYIWRGIYGSRVQIIY